MATNVPLRTSWAVKQPIRCNPFAPDEIGRMNLRFPDNHQPLPVSFLDCTVQALAGAENAQNEA
jgi:hypothetical protein